ncbi:MAG: hypothetical protein A2Y80_02330 [Deltaproteobacteria bacterium RBG_13_58_19]|nr:MAG: hypothetical protein A2Y80_02330 [Deltaproteobacteria bacterium RBG_13_58_19]
MLAKEDARATRSRLPHEADLLFNQYFPKYQIMALLIKKKMQVLFILFKIYFNFLDNLPNYLGI